MQLTVTQRRDVMVFELAKAPRLVRRELGSSRRCVLASGRAVAAMCATAQGT